MCVCTMILAVRVGRCGSGVSVPPDHTPSHFVLPALEGTLGLMVLGQRDNHQILLPQVLEMAGPIFTNEELEAPRKT